jgi:hypothetical protein
MSDELERALAFAHAALEHPSLENVERARRHATAVLARLQRTRLTLGEAPRTLLMATQLRTVLNAVDEARTGEAL